MNDTVPAKEQSLASQLMQSIDSNRIASLAKELLDNDMAEDMESATELARRMYAAPLSQGFAVGG